jgi:hypothetical protein
MIVLSVQSRTGRGVKYMDIDKRESGISAPCVLDLEAVEDGDDTRTPRGGQDHVRVLGRGGDGGDPASMAGKRTEEAKTLSHS